ncbi:MAG: efflux RND transporter periplasmic adaptor subunit, partial [Acidimicrobiia bacterium]
APVGTELVLSGTATARRTSMLSPLTDGLVAEMLVDVGDHVDAGQVIARLDAVISRHELATSEAALAEGQARLADAERRRDEAAEVHARNLIAESTYETAVAEAGILAADVRRLEAEYARQREIVTRHTIKAPFAGIIATKLAEAGQWVQRGNALFQLVDTDVLRVDVPVPQSYYGDLEAGAPVTVRFDAAPADPIETRLTTRVAVGDPAARTFLARIEIDNGDLRFAPGMSARVVLRPGASEGAQALQVPRDAVGRQPDGSHQVWRVRGTQVEPVAVRVERFSGSAAVLAPGSISVGDQVVIRGNEGLRPDQAVRIVEPTS